ncbi:MAG: urea transporter, urea binding protein [Holophagaceae bacterium]|nr:urea transporter, urea binding protein [Holophagaceae bacterium]
MRRMLLALSIPMLILAKDPVDNLPDFSQVHRSTIPSDGNRKVEDHFPTAGARGRELAKVKVPGKASGLTGTTQAVTHPLGVDIKVGLVHAQTGIFAPMGQGGVFGAQAAVEDINKLGGVQVGDQKLPIQLVVVDNESDVYKAGSLAQGLINQNGVSFIVSGDEPPPMHVGVSFVCERYKVPYITSVGPLESWVGMRNLTPTKWQYTWSTGLMAIATPATGNDFRAGRPGYTVLDTWKDMLDQLGSQTNKKVGLLASDEPDGRGWYMVFGPALAKMGYTGVGLDRNLGLMPMETTDFSSVITAWKDAGVEILWGNAPGPFFGAIWKQCKALGFTPKIAMISRGAIYYNDANSWGSDLAAGIGSEIWWDPSFKGCPGIGDTTPLSLAARWKAAKNQPLNPAIGPGYRSVQVLVDAIQRAGSLDADKVNAALKDTNLLTIGHRVKFDENHFSRGPVLFGQWFKTEGPEKWELKVVSSKHDFATKIADPVFPLPVESEEPLE